MMLSIEPLMYGTLCEPIDSNATGLVTIRSPDQIARSRLAPSKMTGTVKHGATPVGTMSIWAVYAPAYHIRLSWSSLDRNQPWYWSGPARKALKFRPAALTVSVPGVVSSIDWNRKPPRRPPV